jgi:hypothetical protein
MQPQRPMRVAATKFIPTSQDGLVSRPRNLDQNVGIDQDRFQDASLLSRVPLRSRRT